MSDSELSDAAPESDQRIETALRAKVQDLFHSGRHEELTVKRVRTAVADQLNLGDFFKTHAAWKDRSKEVISDEVTSLEEGKNTKSLPTSPTTSPPKKKRTAPPKKLKNGSGRATHAASASPDRPKPRKRKRTTLPTSEDEDNDAGVAHAVAQETGHSSPPAEHSNPSSPEKKHDSDDQEDQQRKSEAPEDDPAPQDDSESALSSLIDEPSQKKKRKPEKKSTSKAKDKKNGSKPKRKSGGAAGGSSNAQDDEVKKLQGWLAKCGIRKPWAKVLAPYHTHKAKINHLRELLKDAGMEGRPSMEKARRIKERREFAEDLEAVQEGAKRWGQSQSESEDDSQPRRRLVKGIKKMDFGSDDDDDDDD